MPSGACLRFELDRVEAATQREIALAELSLIIAGHAPVRRVGSMRAPPVCPTQTCPRQREPPEACKPIIYYETQCSE